MADTSPRPRFGGANPERVENASWQAAIAQRWSAARLREHLGAARDGFASRHDFARSHYRDSAQGPFWSWQRLGRSSTPLLDGRIVHVAGGHEDSYDADFCIYSDVVVEHPDGRMEILLYPKDVFPPTDFHSATVIDRAIILIGSLGYIDLRRPGVTQVLKLDTHSWRIDRVATTGESPGWIARHTAARLSGTMIRVSGGTVQTVDGAKANTEMFTLDLETMTWRRAAHDAGATNALDCQDLEAQDREAIEIELALADEKYPLGMDSLKLVDFFERNAAGNWTCVRPVAIAGQSGDVLLIRPRQTFSRGMQWAGIDWHEHLQQLAGRADRH